MDPLVAPTRPRAATRDELSALVVAYADLVAAARQAAEQRLPARARPVPLASLQDKGVPRDVLLWMLYQAHVEHLDATPGLPAARERLAIDDASAFALTRGGEGFANRLLTQGLFSGREHD